MTMEGLFVCKVAAIKVGNVVCQSRTNAETSARVCMPLRERERERGGEGEQRFNVLTSSYASKETLSSKMLPSQG